MSTLVRGGYHHGELRAALLSSASELLESGKPFSLRAVARLAGVSATAPYRHFADRQALESAIAVQGFRDLRTELQHAALGQPPTTDPATESTSSEESTLARSSSEDIAKVALAYVRFALKRPAVFDLMFGARCNTADEERVMAVAELHQLVEAAVHSAFPDRDATALGLALWSTAHGLAFLHLNGKMSSESDEEVTVRVNAAFNALLA